MSYFNDLSNAMFHEDVIRPQTISSDSTGTGVDTATIGSNLINGRVSLGAVSSLTSLVVTFQASADNSTGWVSCTQPDGTAATITLTAANTDAVIAFQLPRAASETASPYRYVRASWDITGTNCLACGSIFGLIQMPNADDGFLAAPPTIN